MSPWCTWPQDLEQAQKVFAGGQVEGHSERQAALGICFSLPASTAASSEPGSEISSFVDSGDDLSEKLVVTTTGPLVEDLVVQNSNGVNTNMAGTALPSTVAALPLSGAALPLTPSTIQSIVVPLSVQDTPSVAGSSCMPLICMPQVTQAATPLINMLWV